MSERFPRCVILIITLLVLGLGHDVAHAGGRFYGLCRLEKIKGKPQAGYEEFHEFHLVISPPDNSLVGPSVRTGTIDRYTCMEKWPKGGGDYCAYLANDGTYSIILHQPQLFVGRPRIIPNLVAAGGLYEVNVDLNIDYSTWVWDLQNWTTADSPWYQTFTATGLNIVGVSYKLAGNPNFSTTVAILEDNGDPDVRNWTFLGQRTTGITGGGDRWVRWRAGECPTVPGRRYAVRLTGNGGQVNPYKRDKDSWSYVGGQAHNSSGVPQNFDLDFTVFSDNDGTITTVTKRTNDPIGERVLSPAVKWGHTFVSAGKGLAGVNVWADGEGDNWDINFTWKIRQGGPTGPQIGPTKTTRPAWQDGIGTGDHAVSYSPGEVPLTRGETYFIEFASTDGTTYWAPLLTNDPFDGTSYRWNGSSWVAQSPSQDLSMTIVEYSAMPLIELNKTSLSRSVYRGDPLSGDSFTVKNVGFDTLFYEIDDDVDWLSCNPTAGDSIDEADPISVLYSPQSLPTGTYTATITVTGYDRDGIEVINSPEEIDVTLTVYTVGPDFDGDFDVDQDDFGHLQACFTGDGMSQSDPACLDADLDGNEGVGQNDFAIFKNCVSGPNVPANRNCE